MAPGARPGGQQRRLLPSLLALLLALSSAAIVGCAAFERAGQQWWQGRRDSSGQAPDPATTPEAVLQVYAARAVGWRGVLAVHTWIAVKRSGAESYRRYEVMGWGVSQGAPAVRVNRMGPDDHWFGARPDKLVDLRGQGVDTVIDKVEGAIRTYPFPESYRTWPGPNSNTFTAHVGRTVPELRLDLPPTAIGKDYLPNGSVMARSPGGFGGQLSLWGLLGVLAGWEEGVEVNLLGLTVGVDFKEPALKLPVAGRVGHP